MWMDNIKEWTKISYNDCIRVAQSGAGIAERVSALDWLSLRYAAIITLPVSNPGLCP